MTKNILFLTSMLLLAACRDNGMPTTPTDPVTPPPPPQPPAEGTVLSESCDGFTLTQEIADGNDGFTVEVTENSEQCGYVAPPPRGTLLREGCSKEYIGVKWFRYADGNGGYYSEKDAKSYECGYEDPYLEVTVGEAGDRFKPTIIDVLPVQYGEPRPELAWDYARTDSTIGHIRKSVKESRLYIYGDSRVGEGVILINDEEYQYSIGEEPTCEIDRPDSGFSSNLPIDCEGHWQRGGPQKGFIWYGEEDEEIVEVEFVHWEYFGNIAQEGQEIRGEVIYPVGFESGLGEDGMYRIRIDSFQRARSVEENHKIYQRGLRYQEKANEQFERAGIHIRLKMVAAFESNYSAVGARFRTYMEKGYMPGADVVGQTNTSRAGTCGVAFATTYFGPGSEPRTFQSACGYNVWLHELGHNVGMAHGPYNSSNEGTGYIWPAFGHGTMAFCGWYRSSIMSYGNNSEMFSNSKMTCRDYGVPDSKIDVDVYPLQRGPSAEVESSSDEAYHMNRIRFNLALIWHEPEEQLPEELQIQRNIDPEQYQGELIVD